MTYENCVARIVNDNGKERGCVAALMNGGVEVRFNQDAKTTVRATAKGIWNAYCNETVLVDLKIK